MEGKVIYAENIFLLNEPILKRYIRYLSTMYSVIHHKSNALPCAIFRSEIPIW